MYAAKKGGEVLQNGARAIRFRDLQNTITTAFKCAVKQCRAYHGALLQHRGN